MLPPLNARRFLMRLLSIMSGCMHGGWRSIPVRES
jgi:hypothetical protein